MNANEHLFSDLTRSLTSRLHDLGRMPTTVDTAHSESTDMIQRLARAGTSTFIASDVLAHGFPITDPVFADKFIIAALHWDNESTRPKTAAVLSNHRRGGELVAHHLYEAGHRRVILAGPEMMLDDPRRHAAGFIAVWQSLGGRIDRLRLRFQNTNPPTLDTIIMPELFHSPDAPTAVFGTRDFDIYSLHQALALQNFDLAAHCELVGYGNTPWSEIGINGFSSVDWCTDLIAEKVCSLINKADLTGDRSIGTCDWVSPKLVLRSNNQPPLPSAIHQG
jgi:DNA-binding LacI/PurR family transcriptional regulator